MGELASELVVSEERNRQVKDLLDEKVRSQEKIIAQEANPSQQRRAELEKEIAELKNQLMAKSIELQRMETKSDSDENDSVTLGQSQSLIVKVPSLMVGYIIGKKGSRIQHLQDKSGAEIKVY